MGRLGPLFLSGLWWREANVQIMLGDQAEFKGFFLKSVRLVGNEKWNGILGVPLKETTSWMDFVGVSPFLIP